MPAASVIWGFILLLLGGAFLGQNLGYFTLDWWYLVSWWPVLLIVWGVSLLTTHPGRRFFLMMMVLLLSATLVWLTYESGRHRLVGTDETQSVERVEAVKTARFIFESGAGDFVFGGQTDKMVSVHTKTTLGSYSLRQSEADGQPVVRLTLQSVRPLLIPGSWRNRAEVALNDRVNWDISLKIGAANLNMDLSDYQVSNLTVDSGATAMEITLGDRAEELSVTIKTGASSVVVRLPRSVGATISANTGLSSTSFNGFTQTASGRYETDNAKTATRTVDLTFSAGASSITVERL